MKVAVVLGNRMNDDGSFSEKMLERLCLTVCFYREEKPDLIIVSGGAANKNAEPEAHAMKRYLTENGLPEDIIVIEDKSMTTKQNALFSVPVIIRSGADELIIITSRDHMNRWYMNPKRYFKRFLKKCGAAIPVRPYTD